MKIVEDCVRRMVPGHWITEVEASECDVNMLAYPSATSRYTLVIGAWVTLLDGSHEVTFEGFASYADLIQSLDSEESAVAPANGSEQLSLEF
jgi:hypothetical protein